MISVDSSPLPISKKRAPLPIAVWMLSFSTFFINWSSVIVFTCMPLLLTRNFSLRDSVAGSVEGIVEGFSLITRAVAGMLSDIGRKRKRFLMVGYLISLLSRFILAFSGYIEAVVASRFLDKLGNGIQASPREAFVTDATPKALLGKSFGLNKTFAMAGSALGSVLLWWAFHVWGAYWADNLYYILYGSTALMMIGTVILMWGTRDPAPTEAESFERQKSKKTPKTFEQRFVDIVLHIRMFPKSYWTTIAIAFLFKLGYFSGAYIMLFVQRQKFSSVMGIPILNDIEIAPLVMSIQNVSCALLMYPMGFLSDAVDRRGSVIIGLLSMLTALLCFSLGSSYSWIILLGIILYGIQMSMQGALLALLSTTIPSSLRGTGFGIFYFLTGISVIIANMGIMKPISERYSGETAFLVITFPILLALGILIYVPIKKID